ncbi:MAG: helix-turn-helix domain-containing protein [Pseudomonadota bacterium]
MPSKTETPSGAQTVDRACALLRELARSGATGLRLLDLCNSTGLSRPTVHRILQSLQTAHLVQQNPVTRRYALGGGLFELGLAAPSPLVQFPQVRSLVEELAASTDDTVYLMLRSYDDVLCAWRAQGAYPIKANVVALGDRRPISASVAGLALLASLPSAESARLIEGNSGSLPNFCRMTSADVSRHVADARRLGYSVGVNAVMEGVTAVGMAVPATYDRPYLSLSVSAISARIPASRIPELVAQLKQVADRVATVTGSSRLAKAA